MPTTLGMRGDALAVVVVGGLVVVVVAGALVVTGATLVVGASVVTLGLVVVDDSFFVVVVVDFAVVLSSSGVFAPETTAKPPKRSPRVTTTAVKIHLVLVGHCRFIQTRATPSGQQQRQPRITRAMFSYHCGGFSPEAPAKSAPLVGGGGGT